MNSSKHKLKGENRTEDYLKRSNYEPSISLASHLNGIHKELLRPQALCLLCTKLMALLIVMNMRTMTIGLVRTITMTTSTLGTEVIMGSTTGA